MSLYWKEKTIVDSFEQFGCGRWVFWGENFCSNQLRLFWTLVVILSTVYSMISLKLAQILHCCKKSVFYLLILSWDQKVFLLVFPVVLDFLKFLSSFTVMGPLLLKTTKIYEFHDQNFLMLDLLILANVQQTFSIAIIETKFNVWF